MPKLEFPESWASATLATICQFIKNGYSTKQTKDGVGDPVTRIETIATGEINFDRVGYASLTSEKKAQYKLLKGDILFSHINSLEHVGKTALFDDENKVIYHGMNLLSIRPLPLIEPRYLTKFLKSESTRDYYRSKCKRAINQVSINTGEVGALTVPIPPLGEQKRIVAKIESTQEKIKTIELGVTKAEELIGKYREALLQKAFRGELVPQDPNDEPASKLLDRIRADHAKQTDGKKKKKGDLPPIKPEEVPFEIPKSWEWVRLAEIAKIQGGIQKQPCREPKKNKFPFLRVANVLKGRLALSEIHEVELFDSELDKLRLQTFDLLIVEGNGSPNEIGRMAVWNDEIPNCVHQNHIIRARPGGGIVANYVELYWNSSCGREQLKRVAKSTTGLFTLSVSKVGDIQIPLPPHGEQERIEKELHSQLGAIFDVSRTFANAEALIANLRNSVLAVAFSGRLVPQDSSEGTGHDLLNKITLLSTVDDSRPTKERNSKSKKQSKT